MMTVGTYLEEIVERDPDERSPTYNLKTTNQTSAVFHPKVEVLGMKLVGLEPYRVH